MSYLRVYHRSYMPRWLETRKRAGDFGESRERENTRKTLTSLSSLLSSLLSSSSSCPLGLTRCVNPHDNRRRFRRALTQRETAKTHTRTSRTHGTHRETVFSNARADGEDVTAIVKRRPADCRLPSGPRVLNELRSKNCISTEMAAQCNRPRCS